MRNKSGKESMARKTRGKPEAVKRKYDDKEGKGRKKYGKEKSGKVKKGETGQDSVSRRFRKLVTR